MMQRECNAFCTIFFCLFALFIMHGYLHGAASSSSSHSRTSHRGRITQQLYNQWQNALASRQYTQAHLYLELLKQKNPDCIGIKKAKEIAILEHHLRRHMPRTDLKDLYRYAQEINQRDNALGYYYNGLVDLTAHKLYQAKDQFSLALGLRITPAAHPLISICVLHDNLAPIAQYTVSALDTLPEPFIQLVILKLNSKPIYARTAKWLHEKYLQQKSTFEHTPKLRIYPQDAYILLPHTS